MEQRSLLNIAALEYARNGIPVFPIRPKGKIPAVRWGTEATTDPEQINLWWSENAEFNIGIPTGAKSGITVLDFDTPEAWAFGQTEGIPLSPTVRTGKGYHVYCRYQEGVRNFQKRADLPGIDLRGEGGLVVVPPSIHESGAVYTWLDGKTLIDLPLGDLPGWVLPRTYGEKVALEDILCGVAEGGRNNALARLVGAWLSEGMDHQKLIETANAWNSKNRPPLGMTEVLTTVTSIYKREGRSNSGAETQWMDPIAFSQPTLPEITADILPSWLGTYAHAVSLSTQTPEGLAVMMGLSAIATCVQKRFEVCPYGDEYTETLSLWTVTVLASSERKTPVVKAMTAPIFNWEKEQAELLKPLINEVSTNIQISNKRIDRLKQLAANEDNAAARQKIAAQISEIQDNLPDEVRAPRMWVGDTTAESLQDMLAENDEKMAVLTDEGVIFEIMAGLYNEGKVNIDIFLQAYSGSPTRIKRKMRDVSLERPALTFGLAVQPVVIENFAQGSKKQFRGKGALGRFLFCIPESMLGKRSVRQRIPLPPQVKLDYDAGMRRLLSLPRVVDDAGTELPRMLRLDQEALEAWHVFSERVEFMLGPNRELSAMGDWGGKLPGTALRIAGLLHLVEHGVDRFVINRNTIDRSVYLCELLIHHAKAAFGLIGADVVVCGAQKVFRWMLEQGLTVFTKTDCLRAHKSSFQGDELDKALASLEERNIIRPVVIPTAGRSATNYIVNPKLTQTASSGA
jgi:hypothetical protein